MALECLRRVAGDYEGQRALLNYGLRESARQAKPPASPEEDEAVGHRALWERRLGLAAWAAWVGG